MRTIVILSACAALIVGGVLNIVRNIPPPPFEAEMYLPIEGEARVAIAEAGSNGPASLEAPRDVIREQDVTDHLPPQAAVFLDQTKLYDIAQLPFTLQVVSTSVLDASVARSTLAVDGDERPVAEGDEVRIGDGVWTVAAIRRWAGLWPHADGRPFCNLAYSVEDGALQENFMVEGGSWRFFEPEGAVYFAWAGSEDAANALLDTPLGELATVRWGIQDGDRMLWFDGLQIGTGATLSNGDEATLMAVADHEEAIRVAIEGDVEERLVTVEANSVSEDGLIRYEHPASRRYTAIIAGVDPARVAVTGYIGGHEAGRQLLATGAFWSSEDNALRLRVDQVLANALPVPPEDSTAYEIVLARDERVLRVRHGERIRVATNDVMFRRTVEPGDVEARLVANHVGEDKVTTFALRPGETFKVLSWDVTMRPIREEMDAFIIAARFDPGIPMPAWIGGALIVFGLAIAVFRTAVVLGRRRRGVR